ncbi:hypothetical protein BZA77DRAFT_274165 [Pyronema omphalodes]|nr:hypothetical protein BZA77DRAFT_274165 [Pyronema omphalodes]
MATTSAATTSEASSLRNPSPEPRPGQLRVARSWSRLESIEGDEDPLTSSLSRLKGEGAGQDLPEASDNEDEDEEGNPLTAALLPEGFDELPQELINLADRFITSLTKPIHPAPLTISQLSDMFQQFYGAASQAINKHVSQSFLSISSKRPRTKVPNTQMLSKAEIVQKKRDRKMLQVKQIALEEAIEKRVTDALYDKLWRHKSTDDDARDDSLHSKIAALKVVGVNLGHLGIELESEKKVDDVNKELQEAVKSLQQMNNERSPLGKLTKLKVAHKTIVDCLTRHISTTSADSLLPTLIYTLILSPPEPPLNAVSNLYFTQRFRASSFVDGEAAYCLTNLEAAISFLETVDLATLKIEETEETSPPSVPIPMPQSPPSRLFDDPLTKPHVAPATAITIPVLGKNATAASSSSSLLLPGSSTPTRARGLSNLNPIDFAHTAATTAISTADLGVRGIGVALENSYKFLFDRRGDNVPRTLEDARKLVEPTTPVIASVMQRQNSDDSSERTASVRAPSPAPPASPLPPAHSPMAAAAGLAPLQHIGQIGSSIGRFASFGVRGIARTASAISTPTPPPPERKQEEPQVKELLEAFPDLAKDLPAQTEKLEYKVNGRFSGAKEAGELRVAEVQELLNEYQTLIGELRKKGLLDE